MSYNLFDLKENNLTTLFKNSKKENPDEYEEVLEKAIREFNK